jgi:hypothetical protein
MSWFLLKQSVQTKEGVIHSRVSIPSNIACLTSDGFETWEDLEEKESAVCCVGARPDTYLLRVVGIAKTEEEVVLWVHNSSLIHPLTDRQCGK